MSTRTLDQTSIYKYKNQLLTKHQLLMVQKHVCGSRGGDLPSVDLPREWGSVFRNFVFKTFVGDVGPGPGRRGYNQYL